MLVKRSIALSGHRTSIALEPDFWAALDAMAAADGQSTSTLIRITDENRDPETALASALRLLALRDALSRRKDPA